MAYYKSDEHLVLPREPYSYVYNQDVEQECESDEGSDYTDPEESINSIYEEENRKDRMNEQRDQGGKGQTRKHDDEYIPDYEESSPDYRRPTGQRRKDKDDRYNGSREQRQRHSSPASRQRPDRNEVEPIRRGRQSESPRRQDEDRHPGERKERMSKQRSVESKKPSRNFHRTDDIERGPDHSDYSNDSEPDNRYRYQKQEPRRPSHADDDDQNHRKKSRRLEHYDNSDDESQPDDRYKNSKPRRPKHSDNSDSDDRRQGKRSKRPNYSDHSDDDSENDDRYHRNESRRARRNEGNNKPRRHGNHSDSDERPNRSEKRTREDLGRRPKETKERRMREQEAREYSDSSTGSNSDSLEYPNHDAHRSNQDRRRRQQPQYESHPGANQNDDNFLRPHRFGSGNSESNRLISNMRDAVDLIDQLEMPQDSDKPTPIEEETDVNEIQKRRRCWARKCISKNCKVHERTRLIEEAENKDGNKLQNDYQEFVTTAINFRKKTWDRLKEKIQEDVSTLAVWYHAIKSLEGRFGTSIASYFIFIRKLFLLNLVITAIMLLFVVVPQIVSPEVAADEGGEEVKRCSLWYNTIVSNTTDDVKEDILGVLQGTGWMELTIMFIGKYDIGVLELLPSFSYNIPMAYMLSTIAFLLVSLVFMLRSVAQGYKENAVTSEGHLFNYCNSVFCAWDFCITKDKAALLKRETIKTELMSCLTAEDERKRRQDRNRKEKAILYCKRFVINILILSLLGGALYAIYYISLESADLFALTYNATALNFTSFSTDPLKEYAPSLTITFFNTMLPMTFYYLVNFEEYSPAFRVKVNLGRTVILRLTSIMILLVSFDQLVNDKKGNRCNLDCFNSTNGCESKLQCWETYVGQQMYKLVLLDFATAMVSIFLVGCAKKLLVLKFGWKSWEEEFDIAKHVLDLVYSQTLCWLGTFFSPLLPVLCLLKCVIFFYAKKFHLTFNCKPSTTPYRASKSNSFFMIVLLISFSALVLIPISYTISSMKPSRGCSPFRANGNTMWEIITDSIDKWSADSTIFQKTLQFIGTAGFAVPIMIILLLYIYYNYTKAAAYTKMASKLKEHLLLESRDKQFLLKRLNEISLKITPNLLHRDSELRKRSGVATAL